MQWFRPTGLSTYFWIVFAAFSTAAISAQTMPHSAPKGPPSETLREPPPPTAEVDSLWHRLYHSSVLAGRQDTQVPGDAYLAVLDLWAEELSPDAVVLLNELETRLLRARSCYLGRSGQVVAAMEKEYPEAMLAAALLHVHVWQRDLGYFHGFTATNFERVQKWVRRSVKARGKTAQARREAAALLTFMSDLIWVSPYANLLPPAEQNLDEAVQWDPEAAAPRYLRAMINEKLSRYRKALEDYEFLHRKHPEQYDVRLRLAIQQMRLGRKAPAIKHFQTIARAEDAEDWVRAVAFQEWIRASTLKGDVKTAKQVLQEGRRAFPGNARLALQEIEMTRLTETQTSSLSRALLDSWQEDTGITPRARYYLLGPAPELEASHRELNQAVLASAEHLRNAVEQIRRTDRGAASECLGTWRRLVPTPDAASLSEAGQGFRPAVVVPPPPTPEAAPEPQAEIRLPDPASPTRSAPAEPTVYVDPESGQKIIVHDAVDLDLQTIYVTPTTRFGRRITDLRQEELSVVDDGRTQEIVTFAQGEIPFTAGLLLDASGSMNGEPLLRALEGARSFINAMGPHDRARLVVAADRLRGVGPFVTVEDQPSLNDLVAQLDAASAGGGTALFDHLFLSLDSLRPELGRKVVIILSDGFDMMSVIPMETVQDLVRRSQIQLYWVRLGGGLNQRFAPPTSWREPWETVQELEHLQRAVEGSGGRVLDVEGPDEAVEAFLQIVEELRGQIAVGYYADSPRSDGAWRQVDVDSTRRGIRLRHVAGYYDD